MQEPPQWGPLPCLKWHHPVCSLSSYQWSPWLSVQSSSLSSSSSIYGAVIARREIKSQTVGRRERERERTDGDRYSERKKEGERERERLTYLNCLFFSWKKQKDREDKKYCRRRCAVVELRRLWKRYSSLFINWHVPSHIYTWLQGS